MSIKCTSNAIIYTSFRRIFMSYFSGFGSSQRSFFSFRLTNPPTVDRYPFTKCHLFNIYVFTIPKITRHESVIDYIFLLVVIKIVVWRRKFSDLISAIVKAQLKFFLRRHNCAAKYTQYNTVPIFAAKFFRSCESRQWKASSGRCVTGRSCITASRTKYFPTK